MNKFHNQIFRGRGEARNLISNGTTSAERNFTLESTAPTIDIVDEGGKTAVTHF